MLTSLKEFLNKYPNCPLCSGIIAERRMSLKGTSVYSASGSTSIFELRCKEGHYQINVNKYINDGDPYDDVYINSIQFITSDYDVSIYIIEDWMNIIFGEHYAAYDNPEDVCIRELKCNDYERWMLTHEQMLNKLKKLLVIA